jgi:protein ImuA
MTRPESLIGRRPHRAPPVLSLWDAVQLPLARTHELCGRARRTLALHLAAAARRAAGGGPVVWIAPGWDGDRLNTCGVAAILPPQELLFVTPRRAEDMLWAMEEALRAGCVPAVVADLAQAPGMTAVRRLHLAAEAGAGHGFAVPLGLLLTPGAGGAPGVETRWRMDPAHARPGQDLWRLERLRARMAPPQAWWLGDAGLQPIGPDDGGAGISPRHGAGAR